MCKKTPHNFISNLLLLLFLINIPCASRQLEWQKKFGGIFRDDPTSIMCHPDSGYAALSSYQPVSNKNDIWLLRLNSKGDTLWTKFFGGKSTIETPTSLELLPGGFMVIGKITGSTTDENLWLIKCDRNGDTLWSKTFRNISPFSSSITNDSAVVITGTAEKRLFIMKVSFNGDSLFYKTFGDSSANNIGFCVVQTSDKGYAISGQCKVNKSKSSLWFLKFDPNGDTLWTRKFGNSGNDAGSDVLQLSDNSFILAGCKSSVPSGNAKAYLQHLSAQGTTTLWEKYFNEDSSTQSFQKISLCENDNILAVGSRVGHTTSDIIVQMYKLNGDLGFTNTYGAFTSDQTTNIFRDFTISPQGRIIVAAFTQPVQSGQIFIFDAGIVFNQTHLKMSANSYKPVPETVGFYNLLGQKLIPAINGNNRNFGIRVIQKNGGLTYITMQPRSTTN